MKISIREVTEDLVQWTTLDERWYQDRKSGIFYPSVTWICSTGYPKGVAFYKWLASKGWDEAEAIKNAAGNKGSKIHKAIELLLTGNELSYNTALPNDDGTTYSELTVEEWEAIMAFKDWWDSEKPELIASEKSYVNTDIGYGGTVDLQLMIGGVPWVVDLKTGAEIWPEYELQLSAYNRLPLTIDGPERLKDWGENHLGILQIGYRRNKRGWKFTEVQDRWDLFMGAYAVWKNENPDSKPKQVSYPKTIKINLAGGSNAKNG